MDLFTAMDISASGMRAQRTRMNIISSNIANAHTTRTDTGGPYQRKDVIFAYGLQVPRLLWHYHQVEEKAIICLIVVAKVMD